MIRMVVAVALLFGTLVIGSDVSAQSVRVIEWSRGRSPIAVLFVHGLGGCAVPSGKTAATACAAGAEDSFRNPVAEKSWPEIIASDDYRIASTSLADIIPKPLQIRDLGVWGVDYSRLTTAGCPTFSVPEAARLVRTQVEASHLFDRYEQVIIIGHSMGGLIAKNMLLEWQNAGDPDGMLARTIGVLMLGVPSQGSGLAPSAGVMTYVFDSLRIDRITGTCARQVKDLFAGNENTYLSDLERRWERLLNARRSSSHSTAPLVYCAYETVPEPILHGVTSATVVDQIYAHTQCSDEQFALPTYHTMLPKPSGPEDDVHRAWFTRSLDNLFRQWVQWSFSRFDFLPADTFQTFARYVNRKQQAFVLDANEVEDVKPNGGSFSGPDNFVLAAKIAAANPTICLETEWPPSGPGRITLRAVGHCRS